MANASTAVPDATSTAWKSYADEADRTPPMSTDWLEIVTRVSPATLPGTNVTLAWPSALVGVPPALAGINPTSAGTGAAGATAALAALVGVPPTPAALNPASGVTGAAGATA